jgi:hypothetical protein
MKTEEMHQSVLIYNMRIPIVIRALALGIGLFSLYLAVCISLHGLFDINILGNYTAPSGKIAAVVVTVGLWLFMLQVWFGGKLLRWDSELQQLVEEYKILCFPAKDMHRLEQLSAISVTTGRYRGRFWKIYLVYKNGDRVYLTKEYNESAAYDLSRKISECTGLPISDVTPN